MSIFISYCKADEQIAQRLYDELKRRDLDVFFAERSLKSGDKWSKEIRTALDEADCVLLLASKRSNQSAYVQQEVGAAVHDGKDLIPIVWDMEPGELSGWVSEYQALNLFGKTDKEVSVEFERLAKRFQWKEIRKGLLLAGLLVAIPLFLRSK